MTVAQELQKTAEQVALAAGKRLKDMWSEPRELHSKGFRDIVTDADYAAQAMITKLIMERYPNHGFLTEEEDSQLPTEGEYIWIIDPIDGTSNYSRQLHNYCVSVAVAKPAVQTSGLAGLKVVAGAIYDPSHDELYSAALGHGSTLNGRRLRVAERKQMIEAIFSLDWSRSRPHRQFTLDILQNTAHQVKTVRSIGTAALAISWIAAGRIDSYVNVSLNCWDVAAGQLILHEAGGRLTDFEGRDWHGGQNQCLATNGHIHTQLVTTIQSSRSQ